MTQVTLTLSKMATTMASRITSSAFKHRKLCLSLRLKVATSQQYGRSIYTTGAHLKDLYWNDKATEGEPMFDKILIANRGEIACRVMKTCRRMGIKTVAVHSEADSMAVHTRMADEAICIGPAPTSQSYLVMDNILQAVKDTGAQAADIGVQFIGPNSEAIRAMGDKIESKRIATAARVNMIPGHDGVVQDAEHCYPVMVKASAGGGGKGMRIAWNDQECRDAFSVFVDPLMRKKMGDQAIQLAKAVGYDSAGTVEFLVDSKKNFYFLEMNTRLQVEHPITECITGIDIVHQMIRSAKGHELAYTQHDVPVDGWAIECRVYAEDPYKNFGMPSIGRLYKYIEPLHIPHVRCDSGIQEGSQISIYYDPMICKLVTYGDSRTEALDTMVTALDSYVIKGKVLNEVETQELTALTAAIFAKEQLIARTFSNQDRVPMKKDLPMSWHLSVSIADKDVDLSITKKEGRFEVQIGDRVYKVSDTISFSNPLLDIKVDGHSQLIQLTQRLGGGRYQIRFQGTVFPVSVLDQRTAMLYDFMPEKVEIDTSTVILAPMPGMLKSVCVTAGDSVSEGQEVAVLEAMKMQNSLVAAKTGKKWYCL
ncbi:PCCA-like protein [Mya arenaria]|uniref:Propionyl-CoA carboxylase alpha chain, mitochondrial n=1 Tax=Mya arenaria TaxID=6604 RepID=A0ABY7G388_MYAAR|nr:PCCA-like protein [Mya arenaria]